MKDTLSKDIYLANKEFIRDQEENKQATAEQILLWMLMSNKTKIKKAFCGATSTKTMAKLHPQGKHAQWKLEQAFFYVHQQVNYYDLAYIPGFELSEAFRAAFLSNFPSAHDWQLVLNYIPPKLTFNKESRQLVMSA